MKKQILFGTGVLFTTMAIGQVKLQKMPSNVSKEAAVKTVVATERPTNYVQPTQKNSVKKTTSFSYGSIGSTYYDLQSNSSVGDRIWVNADGSIAAVWTIEPAPNDLTYPGRGTGYAYFNGSVWSAAPTARVESQRTGWPNIVNTASGKEAFISHNTVASNLQVTTRATKGTGTWAESTTAIPTATTGGNWWPRMVGTHDTLYSLAITYPTASGGATYNGLDGAVVFSRSKDAGLTWDITNQIPTGLTSADFRGFGGDAYAIACKGPTVAIVAGDSGKDLVMTKSTDGGVTWVSKRVLKFPLPLWNPATTTTDINGDGVADTVSTNDGNLAICLDNSGQAYVFYGLMQILQDAPDGTGTYSYFPGVDGLCMWKESMPVDVGGDTIMGVLDLNGNGTIDLPSVTAPARPFGLYGCSLTSFPSAAVDASGTVYLTYSSILEGSQSVYAPKAVRHVYITKSTNGGTTWATPCDIVGNPDPSLPFEGCYPSMAKNVNGNVHIVYQRDYCAGTGVPPSSGTAPDPENQDKENEIIYFKISTSDIGNCALIDVGVKEQATAVNNISNYPNPAANATTIEVDLKENAKMDVVIMNNMGQAIYSTSVAATAGVNKVDVDLNSFASGIYFYQVKVNGSKPVTKKLIVQH